MRYRITKIIAFLLACVLMCTGLFQANLKVGVIGAILFTAIFLSPDRLPVILNKEPRK